MNRIHLGCTEFEIEDRHVLLQALWLGGARDHDGAFLDEKPQADLPGRLAVMRADQTQLRIISGASARDRAVGGNRQAMRSARRDHLRPTDVTVPFDLSGAARLRRE